MASSVLELPCSPTLLSTDRFDLTDSDADEVPFWEILQAALTAPLTNLNDLIDLLETIAIIRRGTADTDYGLLHATFAKYWKPEEHFFRDTWPILRNLALVLPIHFSSGLQALCTEYDTMIITRRQVACLVVHQFLCTLSTPPWMKDGSPDFHIWYSSETPHPKAVEAYLFALFQYFELIASAELSIIKPSISDWPITFSLRWVDPCYRTTEMYSRRLAEVDVIFQAIPSLATNDETLLGLPHGAAVISANKNIGFGRTASQEEMVVGASPELCIAVLITPTLQDEEVLVVQGAQQMICMSGYGRDAQYATICELDDSERWKNRTVLFMDALELDSYDTTQLTPDLLPGNIDRELQKAYTAFSSSRNTNGEALKTVVTGLWGCGSFGGNRQIKSIIQWLAASLAGTTLRFICSGQDQQSFATNLQLFVKDVSAAGWTVEHLLGILRNLAAGDQGARDLFGLIVAQTLE
ncbi:MAG: hypothetical protein Q9168_003112 [Polycauliona sp. 1 TL-2023]